MVISDRVLAGTTRGLFIEVYAERRKPIRKPEAHPGTRYSPGLRKYREETVLHNHVEGWSPAERLLNRSSNSGVR